jgi:hypothetical protein
MHVSVSVTCTYQRLVNHKVYAGNWPTGHEGFPLLLCHIFLLIAWSWSAGYIVGSVSRRTLWASAALSVPLVFLPLYAHVEALLVLVSSAGHHWSPPRITQRSYLTPLSDRSGTHHDGADGLRMEQQRVVDS